VKRILSFSLLARVSSVPFDLGAKVLIATRIQSWQDEWKTPCFPFLHSTPFFFALNGLVLGRPQLLPTAIKASLAEISHHLQRKIIFPLSLCHLSTCCNL